MNRRYRAARALYSGGWYVALPGVLLRLWWRGRREPAYRRGWRQRLGDVSARAGPRPVWVHAVSVGETAAAEPLVAALLARGQPVWLTATTPAGRARARAAFGDRIDQSYAPLDWPRAVARFFARIAPRAVIVMETELWPNLLAAAHRRRVPVVVANARLSPRSFARYAWIRPLISPLLAAIDAIAAQSAADVARFRALGAPGRRAHVVGNLKYDVATPADTAARGARLRARLAPGVVWLAASTHPGEDEAILDALASARRGRADLGLILAPRHVERAPALAQSAAARGWQVALASSAPAPAAATDVVIADRMGDLPACYAAADFALVAGSLVPVGGHNLIEAAAAGCPVIVGPYRDKIADLARVFAGALIALADVEELAPTVAALANDRARRGELAARAAARLAAERGAAQRVLTLLDAALSRGAARPQRRSPP